MGDYERADRSQHTVARQPLSHEAVTAADGAYAAREEKSVELEQMKDLGLNSFAALERATQSAVDDLAVEDVQHSSLTMTLLGMAAAAVVGGAAGWIAGAAVGKLIEGLDGPLSSAVKKGLADPVKNALHGAEKREAKVNRDIRLSFRDAINLQLLSARARFLATWPVARKQFDLLSTEQLALINNVSAGVDVRTLYESMRHETFIAWVNFLARAKHGEMTRWDSWERHGSPDAVALEGALPHPEAKRASETSNVDPNKAASAHESHSGGLLQIFVFETTHGARLINRSGYGVRLDGAGPKVREALVQHGGHVRDLPVNKVVRVCSPLTDPPKQIACVVVTADGYVRASEGFDQLHFEPKASEGLWQRDDGFGECLDQLRRGDETNACHREPSSMNTRLIRIAEAAQNVPVATLEVS